MSNNVKLSDLISKVDEIKESKKEIKEIYIKSLDGIIKVQKPHKDICMQAYDHERSDEYLIYECVVEPDLKSKELHKAYNVVDPLDIVNQVFEPGEVSYLGMTLLSIAGYDDLAVRLVDDIKK